MKTSTSSLTDEQRAALVAALENDGNMSGSFCTVVMALDLSKLGLIHMSQVTSPLTPAGRMLAEVCQECEELRAAGGDS